MLKRVAYLLSTPCTNLFPVFVRVRLCSAQSFCICCSPFCTSITLTIHLHSLLDLGVPCSSFTSHTKHDFLVEAFLVTSTRSINSVLPNMYFLTLQPNTYYTLFKSKHRGWYHCCSWKRPETNTFLISNIRIFFYCIFFIDIITMHSPVKRASFIIINTKFI